MGVLLIKESSCGSKGAKAMNDADLLNDLRYLRDVVARTRPPTVNHDWPLAVSWGCIIMIGYAICALLGISGRLDLIPWVMPLLICLIGWPLHWYLGRKTRLSIEHRGARPRFRKDLMYCWAATTGMGLLWTAALIGSGI